MSIRSIDATFLLVFLQKRAKREKEYMIETPEEQAEMRGPGLSHESAKIVLADKAFHSSEDEGM